MRCSRWRGREEGVMVAGDGKRLAGRVAIVTGAGSRAEGIGNGRAAAILLAREGAKVALVDANPDWAERTRDMIGDEGGDCTVIQADVTRAEDCRRIVAETLMQW